MNHGQGRNRKGYLYRRWQKKKYEAEDPSVAGKGVFYLRYVVDGRVIEPSIDPCPIFGMNVFPCHLFFDSVLLVNKWRIKK